MDECGDGERGIYVINGIPLIPAPVLAARIGVDRSFLTMAIGMFIARNEKAALFFPRFKDCYGVTLEGALLLRIDPAWTEKHRDNPKLGQALADIITTLRWLRSKSDPERVKFIDSIFLPG